MSSDSRRAENLKANRIPPDGYLLWVDGKLKTRYETAEEAANAGEKLKVSFPVVQVAVFDAATRTLTPVELPGKV
jgi:hypothetical protein